MEIEKITLEPRWENTPVAKRFTSSNLNLECSKNSDGSITATRIVLKAGETYQYDGAPAIVRGYQGEDALFRQVATPGSSSDGYRSNSGTINYQFICLTSKADITLFEGFIA